MRYLLDVFSDYFYGGGKKKKEQASGNAARDVLEKWIGFFGTHGTILANKDGRFTGWVGVRFFCDQKNATLHTVIHGRRQSLGILRGDICI